MFENCEFCEKRGSSKCEFCQNWDFEIMNFVNKWDFENVNFVKNEIFKLWIFLTYIFKHWKSLLFRWELRVPKNCTCVIAIFSATFYILRCFARHSIRVSMNHLFQWKCSTLLRWLLHMKQIKSYLLQMTQQAWILRKCVTLTFIGNFRYSFRKST